MRVKNVLIALLTLWCLGTFPASVHAEPAPAAPAGSSQGPASFPPPPWQPRWNGPRELPASIEDFESDETLRRWTAESGTVALAGERFKHGSRSLRWQWDRAGAVLTWIFPEAFQGPTLLQTKEGPYFNWTTHPKLNTSRGPKRDETFNFWFYNEVPMKNVLSVEFLDKDSRVLAHCWWPLYFRGWRPLCAPYEQIFGEAKQDRLRQVVGVRFKAPAGIAKGRGYFDYVRTRSRAGVLWDLQHPWRHWPQRLDDPHPEKYIYSPFDLALNRPDLPALVPEEQLSPRQKQDIVQIAKAIQRQNAVQSAHRSGSSIEGLTNPGDTSVSDDAYVFPQDFFSAKSDPVDTEGRPAVESASSKSGKPDRNTVALCEKFRAVFHFQRDKEGRLTGVPIEGRNLYGLPPIPDSIDESLLPQWARAFAACYRAAQFRHDAASAQLALEGLRDFCNYCLDQGAAAGGMNGPSGGFGHEFLTTMRGPLKQIGVYDEVAMAAVWSSTGYLPITQRISQVGDSFKGGSGNTDMIYGTYETALRMMMYLPPSQRLQYLQGYSRILSLICDQQSPLCAHEPFEIDGAFMHHDMFNLNYGGAAYETLCRLAAVFSKTSFPMTPGAIESLKRTSRLIAFLGNTSHAPPNASGYTGDIKRCLCINQVEELARLGTPDGKPIDPEMASLYLALARPYVSLPAEAREILSDADRPPMLSEDPLLRKSLDIRHVEAVVKEFTARGCSPQSLEGHSTLNSAAGAIHRRGPWSVTFFGLTHLHRPVESSGGTYIRSIYNRYIRTGSAFVTSAGTPPSPYASGCRLQGWDWRFIPGATSMLTDPLRTCGAYTPWRDYGEIRPGSPQPLSKELGDLRDRLETTMRGGADLDGDGIWSFECLTSSPGVQFRKSAFCFGRRVTMITTDVAHGPLAWPEDKNVPLVTTLYQNAFGECLVTDTDPNPPQSVQPRDEPCWADGRKLDQFPHEVVLAGDAAHWVIDNKKTGYYIHAGNDPLRLARRSQQWTYCHSGAFLKKSLGDFRKAMHNNRREWDPSNYEPTKGDFALGWFEHGPAPAAAHGAYTLLPLSTPQEMEGLAAAMKNEATAPYRILQQDSQAHIVWDRASDTTGYVVFDSAWKPATSQMLRAVNRPCYVMLRPKGSQLIISATSTDKNRWGLLMKGRHTQSEMSDRHDPTATDRAAVIELTLSGAWRVPARASKGCTAVVKSGTTRVTIPYNDFLPIRLTLESAGLPLP